MHMSTGIDTRLRLAIASALLGAASLASAQAALTWQTVANNLAEIPDTAGRTFNSYGQPSVNAGGLVAFRGRSTGQDSGPVRGVYARDMGRLLPLREIAAAGDPVPDPNNVVYNDLLAPFNEFPAFPRMDIASTAIATRGQSRPVWEYPVGTEPAPGEEVEVTRVGTSGIYLERLPVLSLVTGASQLGVVPGFERFAVPVPGLAMHTRFDQFPGSPAVMSRDLIAFKGNYTDTRGTADEADDGSYTGVFLRNVRADKLMAPVQLIATSQFTMIPGTDVLFGSTAPPSAADGKVLFLGSDNEETPTLGGIYMAEAKAPGNLIPLVEVGDPVPGETGHTFMKFGEALSVGTKARQVAFWAGWGGYVESAPLRCPDEGNKELVAYCKANADGAVLMVPKYQGIFVHDTKTGLGTRVASTSTGIADFQYCVYSGRPPGAGGSHGEDTEDEGELPRWRCSAFAALSAQGGTWYQVAFKSTTVDGRTGIHLWDSRPAVPLQKLVEIGDDAATLDPQAPPGALVATLGIERDGFRNGWLAITASMAVPVTAAGTEVGDEEETEVEGMAGVYVTRLPGWEEPAF
jgi:hypothetical protein